MPPTYTELRSFFQQDASAFRLEDVLLHRQPSGTWHPVAYASRALTPTEQNYV